MSAYLTPARTIWFIGIIALALIAKFRWYGSDGENWKYTIHGDGSGQYYYLPAALIYHNLERPVSEPPPGNFFSRANERWVNRFYCGTAVSIAPFFGLAAVVSSITGEPLDGYSLYFQCGVSVAALFYFLAGLFFLSMLLKQFGITDKWITITLLLISFGTNILYYVVYEPSMAHVYAFAYITIFLYFAKKICTGKFSTLDVIACFAAFAMVVLVRSVNVLMLLALPFIAGSMNELRSAITALIRRKKALVVGMMVFACLISIQFLLYYLQTGKAFLNSYSDAEGFDFSSPRIAGFLFSYRKGLFVYTPLLLLSLAGLIILFRKDRFRLLSVLIFLSVIVYLLASLRNWYGGDSFGMRHMIDYYALFAILLALALQNLKAIARYMLITLSVLCVFLNLVQSYQYATYILHPATMNKEKYWYAFLKTGKEYVGTIAGTDDTPGELKEKPVLKYFTSFEKSEAAFRHGNIQQSDHVAAGRSVAAFDADTEFGAEVTMQRDVIRSDERYFIRARLKRYEQEKHAANKALLVLCVDSANGKNHLLEYYRINELPREEFNVWHEVNFNFPLPPIQLDDPIVRFYIWNPEKRAFYIDELGIEIYRVKEK